MHPRAKNPHPPPPLAGMGTQHQQYLLKLSLLATIISCCGRWHCPFPSRNKKSSPSPSLGLTSTCKTWPIKNLPSFWLRSLGQSGPISVFSTFPTNAQQGLSFCGGCFFGEVGAAVEGLLLGFGAATNWHTAEERPNSDNVWTPGSSGVEHNRAREWRERWGPQTQHSVFASAQGSPLPGACWSCESQYICFLLSLLSWVFSLHELEKVLVYSLHCPVLDADEHPL